MRRPRPGETEPGNGDAIQSLWAWWDADGRVAAEKGITGNGFDSFIAQIDPLVKAIHRDLEWELASGRRAEHALIVTSGGIPDLRRRAEQWYQRSPAVSATWEYHPARQADPDALTNTLMFEGHKLDLPELRFDLHVDEDRQRIDAVVFHPSFAGMRPGTRDRVTYLALDWALGEDGVVRWIGDVEASIAKPAAGLPADGLVETVDALASRASGPQWALLRGEHDGLLVVASVALTAKWIDHPLMDLHIEVLLPFGDRNSMPDPKLLAQLRAMEDELTEVLPPHAMLVAHVTTAGVRTLHLYADSDDRALADAMRSAVSKWPGATVKARLDAGWREIRHITG